MWIFVKILDSAKIIVFIMKITTSPSSQHSLKMVETNSRNTFYFIHSRISFLFLTSISFDKLLLVYISNFSIVPREVEKRGNFPVLPFTHSFLPFPVSRSVVYWWSGIARLLDTESGVVCLVFGCSALWLEDAILLHQWTVVDSGRQVVINGQPRPMKRWVCVRIVVVFAVWRMTLRSVFLRGDPLKLALNLFWHTQLC